ncbi:MAG: hypothetical protein KDD84_01090 [Caldilineaceae bacterium]|nr:hypothetical protein [Caldilineaceae bacterium]
MHRRISFITVVLLLLVSSFGVSACTVDHDADAAEISMMDAGHMPASVRRAPQRVQDAYRFVGANADVLSQFPCYCGCGPMGHGSNYACFWQREGVLDTHALGCGICVDIAQDVMRGMKQGQSLAEIRAQVDSDYSRFGPPTNTPPIAER